MGTGNGKGTTTLTLPYPGLSAGGSPASTGTHRSSAEAQQVMHTTGARLYPGEALR